MKIIGAGLAFRVPRFVFSEQRETRKQGPGTRNQQLITLYIYHGKSN